MQYLILFSSVLPLNHRLLESTAFRMASVRHQLLPLKHCSENFVHEFVEWNLSLACLCDVNLFILQVKLTTWEISYVDSALISSADRISRLAHRPNSSIDDQSKFFNQNYFQFPSRKDNKCDSAIVKSANNQNG